MAWVDPLRHLSPLSSHPSLSPSLSPAPSERTLTVVEASVRLDQLKSQSCASSRLLQAFLENLDNDGQLVLAADIGICQDDQRLIQLANHLLDAILKPFRLAGGQAPPPLTTPPTEGAEQAIDLSMATMQTSSRAEQSKLRNDCLRRDGYRCVYSGYWDVASSEEHLSAPPSGARHSFTECAHIIPFALGSFDERDAVQTRNKAIIWFSLHRYFPALDGKIDARTINQHANAMMLADAVHKFFGSYRIAFLPQDPPNTYSATLLGPALPVDSKSGSSIVHFASADDSVPMPDKDFLKVHYIISQILRVSGFGDAISRAARMAYLDLDCHMLHPSGSTDVGGKLSRLLLTSVQTDNAEITNQDHDAIDGLRKPP